MVKADKVSKVTQTLVARAKAGQIRAKIDDAQLVEILGDAGASERSVTVEVSWSPPSRLVLWVRAVRLTPLHTAAAFHPVLQNMRKRNAFDEDADDMDDY